MTANSLPRWATILSDIEANMAPLVIGGEDLAPNWTGKIDQVKIYNRALTDQQVADLFNNP